MAIFYQNQLRNYYFGTTGSLGLMYYGNTEVNYGIVSGGGGGNDPDAQAFINATGISGTTATAINQLVLDLKAYSLWSKFYWIYPFVGGSSNSTSYNLINTGSYQMTWNGGMSFASSGVTGNGTDGYGNTNSTIDIFPQNSIFAGFVQTSNNTPAKSEEVGFGGAKTNSWIQVTTNIPAVGNSAFGRAGNVISLNGGTINPICMISVNRTDDNATLYRNTTALNTINSPYTKTIVNVPILVFNFWYETSPYTNSWANQTYTTAFAGQGLTTGELSNFYTAITAFNTTLGR